MSLNLLIVALLCLVPLIIAAVVAAVVIIYARKRQAPGGGASPAQAPGGPQGGELSALDILKARLAQGEITREQFEQMRKDLE